MLVVGSLRGQASLGDRRYATHMQECCSSAHTSAGIAGALQVHLVLSLLSRLKKDKRRNVQVWPCRGMERKEKRGSHDSRKVKR